jgi:hypothetical protein
MIKQQHRPVPRFPDQTARLLRFLIATSCAFVQSAGAQGPSYSVVSLGALVPDRAALAGQHVQTTGLLATTSEGAMLRTRPVDPAGLSVDLREVPSDQLASVRMKCRFGCPATVRGMLAVQGDVARIVARAILVE